MADSEVRRLRSVYAAYETDDKRVAWDGDNPGNAAIVAEREEALRSLLTGPLLSPRVLALGCGTHGDESWIKALGAVDPIVVRADVRVDALGATRGAVAADGRRLPLADAVIDVVIVATVFSSVIDERNRSAIAREILRVLRSGGFVVWYDTRVPNPRNRAVRPVSSRELRRLFPDASIVARRVTFLPPLARRLASRPWIYRMLSPLARTHLLAVIQPRRAGGRLLIISHTKHHRRDGQTVAWGPVAREVDHLAVLFDEVVHLAPLHSGPGSVAWRPYRGPVRLEPVEPVGGEGPSAKLDVLLRVPRYARAVWRAARDADVVHVRCPANLSLVALVVLAIRRHPRRRWAKYAGEWAPAGGEPWSYRFQRWILRRGAGRLPVTVNGGEAAPGIVPLLNPCLGAGDLDEPRRAAPEGQTRVVFVGYVLEAKGILLVIDAVDRAQRAGADITLDVIGDGPDRASAEQAAELLSPGSVSFHGWLPAEDVHRQLARVDVIVLPSVSEGFPKAVAEAMAHGVVPIVSAASAVVPFLRSHGVGAIVSREASAVADALLAYARDPDRLDDERRRCEATAPLFTYDVYVARIRDLIGSSR